MQLGNIVLKSPASLDLIILPDQFLYGINFLKMGKSPGKWIKGILFGKKTSNSNLSKRRELSRSASENPARGSSKEQVSTLIVDASSSYEPVPGAVVNIEKTDFDNGMGANLPGDGAVSLSANQGGDGSAVSNSGVPNYSEKTRLEQAATVVQAFFRGYQARHAFQALKGIIRLQAVFRGRLVRRQAVSTLFCMQGIVKFQALARGHMVRRSSFATEQCTKQRIVAKDVKRRVSCEINNYSGADNFLTNAFIYKLLSSSPTSLPLRLQYGTGEPNSSWDWLLRWSTSHVWALNSKQKENTDVKLLTVKVEKAKSMRNGQRMRHANVRNGRNNANSEPEKLRHNSRNFSRQSVKSARELPQKGIDKVNHGLKKISKPNLETSTQAKVIVENPKKYPTKLLKSPAPKFSEQATNTTSDKSMEDLEEAVSIPTYVVSSLELPGENGPVNQLNGHLASKEHPKLASNENQDNLLLDKDSRSENHKSNGRTSLPAKHDDQDANPHSVTKIRSYMAKTASSEAKAKLQVPPRSGHDAADKSGLTRRLSLPSSNNGKLSSSPRVNRLVQSNEQEGIGGDRFLSSSKEVTNKVILQADWKR